MISKLFAVVGLGVCVAATSAYAIDVDGNLDSGYGAAKSEVLYVPPPPPPGTPVNGNFDSPTPFSNFLGYNVYLTDSGGFVYGFLQGTSGSSAGAFANLYFGDPGTSGVAGSRGSTIGFELSETTQRAFAPNIGAASYVSTPGVSFAALGNNIEFAIPESYFTSPLSVDVNAGIAPNGTLALRLSQSFGYTVAGGESYGPNRLGTVTLGTNAVAVPGPVAGAGLVPLLGLAGAWLTRRRKRLAA